MNCSANAIMQAAAFGQLNKAKLGIWEALQHLNSVDDLRGNVAAGGDEPRMSLFEHAVQTAELCRLAHPHHDWLHLVGLLHGLGKLMALPRSATLLSQLVPLSHVCCCFAHSALLSC